MVKQVTSMRGIEEMIKQDKATQIYPVYIYIDIMDNIAHHSMLRCLKWMNKSLACSLACLFSLVLSCLLSLLYPYLTLKFYVHPVCSFAEQLSLTAILTGFRCDPRRIGH